MQLRKTSTREFLKTANSARPLDSRYFAVFFKTHSCLFIRNCTRNYTITYTNILYILMINNVYIHFITNYVTNILSNILQLLRITDGVFMTFGLLVSDLFEFMLFLRNAPIIR